MSQTQSQPWYRDARVLWQRPAEFWPARHHAPAERLNCYVRLAAYCGLALLVLQGRLEHAVAAATVVGALSLSFHHGRRRGRADDDDEWEDGGAAASGGCTRSSPANPFANYLVSDLPSRPAACKYEQHAAEVEANFARGLVKNMYDVYDKENSRRQFVTMPVTTSAPDTVAFAHYCYGIGPTCKEDGTRCTGT